MRRTLLALSIATLPGLSAAAALPSAIGAVTVYQDRAVVTRQASAELAAGELVLEKLPPRCRTTPCRSRPKAPARPRCWM